MLDICQVSAISRRRLGERLSAVHTTRLSERQVIADLPPTTASVKPRPDSLLHSLLRQSRLAGDVFQLPTGDWRLALGLQVSESAFKSPSKGTSLLHPVWCQSVPLSTLNSAPTQVASS
ncbi:hypothetical protein SRHO_G00308020 [Serrasalmus rhombeus]